jgi:hypothetical protein
MVPALLSNSDNSFGSIKEGAMSPEKPPVDRRQNEEEPLQGWPGYRTNPGRSGLDPVDTPAEEGHMLGIFLRNLFTLRIRTRNLFYLVMMFVFGLVPFIALAALFLGNTLWSGPNAWTGVVFLGLVLVVSGYISLNFILSILEILGFIPPQRPVRQVHAEAHAPEHKQPKRRKDFR